MATVTTSTIVESVPDGSRKRNRYRFTISDGSVHERISWIAGEVNDNDDLNARAAMTLDELVQAEIGALLS